MWNLLWKTAPRIKLRYITLGLNEYTQYKIYYEQRHKESKLRYLTMNLNDYDCGKFAIKTGTKNQTQVFYNEYILWANLLWGKAQSIKTLWLVDVNIYPVKFAMKKGTKNQNIDISQWI